MLKLSVLTLLVMLFHRCLCSRITKIRYQIRFDQLVCCLRRWFIGCQKSFCKIGLDETYTGVEEVEGEFELTEAVEDGPRPFKVFWTLVCKEPPLVPESLVF